MKIPSLQSRESKGGSNRESKGGSNRELSGVIGSNRELSKVIESYRKLSKVIESYRELSKVESPLSLSTFAFQLSITLDHSRLSITLASHLFKRTHNFLLPPPADFHPAVVFQYGKSIVVYKGYVFFIDQMAFMRPDKLLRREQGIIFAKCP